MTTILSVVGPESIWMVADRRLSFKGHPPRDDARKIFFLETTDGVAILGYAGLGATPRGTEPADWMSAVVRGRSLPLEISLGVLAEAMKKQFSRHLVNMPGTGVPAHHVIVPAFFGDEPRLYSIDMVFSPDRKRYKFRYTRHVSFKTASGFQRAPRLAIGGTGSEYLVKNKKWVRNLLRMIRAHDRGSIPLLAVSDHMASLNYEVHLGVPDNSVGPRSIVAWRHSKGGVHKGGGGHQFYTGTTRDASTLPLPTIANGMDVTAIAGVVMPQMAKMLEAMKAGKPIMETDKNVNNIELSRLPDKPDETLR